VEMPPAKDGALARKKGKKVKVLKRPKPKIPYNKSMDSHALFYDRGSEGASQGKKGCSSLWALECGAVCSWTAPIAVACASMFSHSHSFLCRSRSDA
jgi:hypothetical protein